MENYVGKICPFCKAEIKEGDDIKICPNCGVPHHEKCWEENKGCANPACSKEHYETQDTISTDICVNCGAVLEGGQDFCPKCGTPKGSVKKKVCSRCGAELQEGQEFCHKCGQKISLTTDISNPSVFYQPNTNTSNGNKKTPIKLIVAAIIIIAVIASGVVLAPNLFVSVEDLCAEGNYVKAYELADESEKIEILAENVAAVQSAFSVDYLKDPSSFVLRDAYYNESTSDEGDTTKQLVLYISGANSYGASVSSYWFYVWDAEEDEWSYFTSVSSLEEEEYSSYDDDDERLEKAINNIARECIDIVMNDGIKLSKDAVARINNMFEADTLDDVELIEAN